MIKMRYINILTVLYLIKKTNLYQFLVLLSKFYTVVIHSFHKFDDFQDAHIE